MAGTLLGKDQILKVNASYPLLFDHIKSLLTDKSEPVDLMRVHFLTEYLDTTEIAHIFAALPFLSPAEKRALVRAAIFDVLLNREPVKLEIPKTDNAGVTAVKGEVTLKEFKPAQFNLNVNTAEAVKVEIAPTPPTAAHTPIVKCLNVATIKDHQGQ
jgi:hypothetical protein